MALTDTVVRWSSGFIWFLHRSSGFYLTMRPRGYRKVRAFISVICFISPEQGASLAVCKATHVADKVTTLICSVLHCCTWTCLVKYALASTAGAHFDGYPKTAMFLTL